jgi:hypothetical protein
MKPCLASRLQPLAAVLSLLACGHGGPASTPADATGGLVAGRNILMVVGDANRTVSPRGSGIGDRFLKNRLETVLGHHVTLADDIAARDALVAAAQAADMVLVCESVASANLQDKLKGVSTPILSYEAFIQDEMGFTPPGPPGDPGEPTQFALGVRLSDNKIDIVDPAHPLAAGLSGTVVVYTENKEISWGKVAKTAEVVATLAGDPTGAAIYVYRKGAVLHDGTMAAGLRVNFFLEDDNKTGTPNLMTADGLKLFDTAVRFVLAGGK